MSEQSELKSYKFRNEREAEWKSLETLLSKIQNSGVKGLSREEMLELPRLYRSTVSSLSTARAISLDRNLTDYLETLCTRAYIFMYGPRTSVLRRVREFFTKDWPEAVAKAGWATLLSAFCFFGAGLIGYLFFNC